MIAVKWEFEGTGAEVAAAQMVVEKILARCQRALRNVWCPVHGSGVALTVRGRTLEELELGIDEIEGLRALQDPLRHRAGYFGRDDRSARQFDFRRAPDQYRDLVQRSESAEHRRHMTRIDHPDHGHDRDAVFDLDSG